MEYVYVIKILEVNIYAEWCVLILICNEIKDGFKQSVFPGWEVKTALELGVGEAHESKCQRSKISGLVLIKSFSFFQFEITEC